MNKRFVIRNGKIISDEAKVVKPIETDARANRNAMKVNHRKDLLQKNETAYYKAYKDQLDNLSPELKRLLS